MAPWPCSRDETRVGIPRVGSEVFGAIGKSPAVVASAPLVELSAVLVGSLFEHGLAEIIRLCFWLDSFPRLGMAPWPCSRDETRVGTPRVGSEVFGAIGKSPAVAASAPLVELSAVLAGSPLEHGSAKTDCLCRPLQGLSGLNQRLRLCFVICLGNTAHVGSSRAC